MTGEIYTIGHSNHQPAEFFQRLRQHQIELLVDVRSNPHSGYVPDFDRTKLARLCREHGVEYLFLGHLLGGKPPDNSVTDAQNKTGYHLLVQKDYFLSGIDQLLKRCRTQKLCIMCSEGSPEKCHRTILIAPVLEEKNVRVQHILPDGSLQDTAQLKRSANQGQMSLFD